MTRTASGSTVECRTVADRYDITLVRYLLGIGSGSGAQDIWALLPELARRVALSGITVNSSGQLVISGTVTLSGPTTLSAIAANLLFSPDGSFNIGAAGATRPNNIFAAGGIDAAGIVSSASNVATPAGGSATAKITIGSSGIAVYIGSGAPTVSAPKGSLYLRSDGSATNNRAYINTDGGTTWTPLTTAA